MVLVWRHFIETVADCLRAAPILVFGDCSDGLARD